jgi:hypothetical protein
MHLIKNKKRWVIDRLKAKILRYYKIVKPLSKVMLGTTLEGKNTTFVVNSAKKEPRKFFRARIYSLPRLVHKFKTEPNNSLQKEEMRELSETLPLLLLHIAITEEKWYIGKIENHPFDIFIAPERFVKKEGKNVNIYRGLHIQTKRLYKYPPERMTLDEWATFLQTIIEEKIASVNFGFNGHIHFYNQIPFSEPIEINKLRKLFKRLYVPYNKYIDSISVSIEVVNSKKETTVITWNIYPLVSKMIGVFDLDLKKAKEVYLEEDIFRMMTARAITAKNLDNSQ